MHNGFHKLEIKADGAYVRNLYDIRILLDGNPIYPTELRLDLLAGEVPQVYIGLDVGELDISADALVALQAHVEERSID